MSRNQRRNFDVDYSEGGSIVPVNRLQNMLQQVQQQGGVINQQQGNVSPMMTYDTQPVEVRYITAPSTYKPKIPQIEIPYVETWKAQSSSTTPAESLEVCLVSCLLSWGLYKIACRSGCSWTLVVCNGH